MKVLSLNEQMMEAHELLEWSYFQLEEDFEDTLDE
jgi:hypothetical protein